MLSDGARDLRPVACESDGGDSDGQVSPEFSAVQCISFFRFGRVSYYAFHTYHTNIGNILLSIEDILYMLPRIAKISHIGGKVVPELGENGLSSGGGQGGSRTEDEDFFPFFSRAPRIRGSWLLSPPSLKLQCNNSTLVVRFVYSEYGLCLDLVTVTHKRVDRLCARPVEPRARTESH